MIPLTLRKTDVRNERRDGQKQPEEDGQPALRRGPAIATSTG